MKIVSKCVRTQKKSNEGLQAVGWTVLAALLTALVNYSFWRFRSIHAEKKNKRETDYQLNASKKQRFYESELRQEEMKLKSKLRMNEMELKSKLKQDEKIFALQFTQNQKSAKNVESDVLDSKEKIEVMPKPISELVFNQRDSEIRYLFARFFEVGTISILAGRTNCGKTYLLYHILYTIAEGLPSGLVDDELDNNEFLSEVVAYMGESTVADLQSRYKSHPNLRIFHGDDCALFGTDVDLLVKSIKECVDKKTSGQIVIALDNLKKLIGEARDYTKFESLRVKLETVIAEAKMRGVTVSVILVVHTVPDAKTPNINNLGGVKSKTEMTKNIVEMFPLEKLGKEYTMLVPIKCKYDNTLSEKGFIIKQYKSDNEPEKLFERVATMDWEKAVQLKSKDIDELSPETYKLSVNSNSVATDSSLSSSSVSTNTPIALSLVTTNTPVSSSVGRPQTVSEDVILDISIDIQNGMTQKEACSKHAVPRSTYTSRAKALGLI